MPQKRQIKVKDITNDGDWNFNHKCDFWYFMVKDIGEKKIMDYPCPNV